MNILADQKDGGVSRALDLALDGIDLGLVMSNFDHSIDAGKAEALKLKASHGDYAARNFFGTVYYVRQAEAFVCFVQRYGKVIEAIAAPTLEEIMEHCSRKWGSE